MFFLTDGNRPSQLLADLINRDSWYLGSKIQLGIYRSNVNTDSISYSAQYQETLYLPSSRKRHIPKCMSTDFSFLL